MNQWSSTRARRVLAALFRIGWIVKRQSGSHRTLSRPGWPDFVFAFHDNEELGPTIRSARGSRRESNMFRRIPWQDVCKFLAGAFFVSAGILFYLYLARVSVPILGTRFTETPEVSGVRSIVHVVLFLTFFYLGFIRKWKSRSIN